MKKTYIDIEPIKKFIIDGLNNPDLNENFGYDGIRILAELEFAPKADVIEVIHAKWVIDKSFVPFICTCSNCGATYDIDGAFEWPHDPVCGAKMDLKEDI